MPSGYEKSPEYGGPEPSGKEIVRLVVAVAAIGMVIWGLRRLFS